MAVDVPVGGFCIGRLMIAVERTPGWGTLAGGCSLPCSTGCQITDGKRARLAAVK